MNIWKIYSTVLKISVRNVLQYRVNILLNWLLGIFALIVPLAFWKTAYTGQGQISGYNMADMVTYIVLTALLGKLLVYDGIQQEISNDIRGGKLSQYLCRPINYKAYTFFHTIGKRGFDFIIMFFLYTLVILPLYFENYFHLSAVPGNVIPFLTSCLLGITLSFFLYYILGLVAFWMLECSALYVMLGTLFYFLAGGLFPLDLFPVIRTVSKFLPFQYQLFFPVKMYLGGFGQREMLEGILIQLFWCAILWALSVLMWKSGVKRYTSVGN